jgi:radical SAM superfamily enzyme YgiQ (UPF0313 family)
MASVLERERFKVRILDAQAERLLPDAIVRTAAEGKWDLIGITATTGLIRNAAEIAARLKVVLPQVPVVLGGVHPTVLPDEVLALPGVDYVVRGEGEHTLLELAQGKDPASIPGLSWVREGEPVHNNDRQVIDDLDSIPFPAYHLLPMDKYYPAPGAYRRLPATSLLATRGCPGHCTFCYRIFGQRLRVRSGCNVAEEVRLLKERYGIREIAFYDDTFTSVRKNILEFCRILCDERMDVAWSCFSRVDFVDEDLLRAMKQAGCHQIMYGFESACPEILAAIHKKTDLERAYEAVRLTRKAGIDIRAAFMLGNPGETPDTMEQTLRWAVRMNPDIAVFNITTPYPGTEMHAWAKSNGYLLTEDWNEYDLSRSVMRLPTVAPEIVDRFYRKAYRRYYFRPRYIVRRLWRLRQPRHLAAAWRGFKSLLGL